MTVPTGATIEIQGVPRQGAPMRTRIGLPLAAVVFLAMYFAPFPALSPQAHALAAIMAAVVVLWVTEALPMPVTALMAAVACVVLRVAPAKEVFAPFADPLMFLFIGSFMIAKAIMLHGLDRRIAYSVLSHPAVGASPTRILFAFGAVTAVISAWISNTATTAMMYAIGMAILAYMSDAAQKAGRTLDPRFPAGLMLMTAFAASVGGLATPIGTPPNVIGIGFIRTLLGVEITFFRWMTIGVPVVAILFVVLFGYLNALCPAGVRMLEGRQAMITQRRADLGRWTR